MSVEDFWKEIVYLAYISDNDSNWDRVRDSNLYDLIDINYSFGTRKAFKITDKSMYEELQASRGNSFNAYRDVSYNLRKISENMSKPLNDNEKQIISEVIGFQETSKLDFSSIDNFVEIGFRIPRYMKIFKEVFKKKVYGIDVVRSNVLAANIIGFDAFLCDLNNCEDCLSFDNNTLIWCFHVLEHVTDPLKALKTIRKKMSGNSYLHVEIPVENLDIPNYRNGHLFAFRNGDLKKMLNICGFKSVLECNPKSGCERFLVTCE